jgi:hypothetical protein
LTLNWSYAAPSPRGVMKKTYRSLKQMTDNERIELTSPATLRNNFPKIAADADRRFGPHGSLRRGRPRKGERAVGTVATTVKQTPGFWKMMAAKAKAHGLTLHEAMRQALGEWLDTN